MASVLVKSGLLTVALLLVPLLGDFTAYQLGLYLIYGLAAQGIGFVWGRMGILPLGQAVFLGGIAYATAFILRSRSEMGLQLGLIAAALAACTGVAFWLAAAIFRRRADSGPYFSLITLAIAKLCEQLAGSQANITGGFNGLGGFDPVGGLDPYGSLYFLIVAALVFVTA